MIEKVLHRPVTVLMFYLMLVGLMLFALTRLPIELTAEIDFPKLTVVTTWPDASSEMVERTLTTAIEQVATTVSGMKKISSRSSEGSSIVELEFQKKTDMDLARLELSEKLASLMRILPEGATMPRIEKYVPEEFAELQGFMSFHLYGEQTVLQLQRYATEIIRPALLGIKGVADVQVLGGSEREILMLLDESRLKGLGISLNQVLAGIREAQVNAPAGYVESSGLRHSVYVGNVLQRVSDLESVLIPSSIPGSRPRQLSEFCIVQDTVARPLSIVRINGQPAITLEIDKEPGINMLKVASAVDAVVARLRAKFPTGLAVEKMSDKSADIRKEIRELTSKSLLSATFVILILLLFFKSLPLSLIVFLSALFSTAGAIIFLAASNIGLNVITLSALALSIGVIVDNAVVIFENIQRQFEADSLAAINTFARISMGVREMLLPLLAATSTTIGALIPVAFLPDYLRGYFIHFALTAAVTLLFSYLVALTFIPVASNWYRCMRGVKPRATHKPAVTFWRKVEAIYERLLLWNLRHRRLVLLLSLWLIGLPIWLLPAKLEELPLNQVPVAKREQQRLKNNLAHLYNFVAANPIVSNARPYIDHLLGGTSHLFFRYVYKGELWKFGTETYVIVSLRAPQGTELERVDAFAKQIEAVLVPNKALIQRITSRLTNRSAQIQVDFDHATALTATPLIIKDQLTALCANTSGFSVGVYGFGPGFYSGGGMAPNFQIQILGYNYNKVKEIAQQVSAILAHNPRVADIELDRLPWQSVEYELVGQVDREALTRHGVELSDFIASLGLKLRSSIQRQRVKVGGEELRFSLGLQADPGFAIPPLSHSTFPATRFAEDLDVRTLLESSIKVGERVLRIGDLLRINVQPVMPEIRRENQQYTRFISFNFKGPYRFGDYYVDAVIKNTRVSAGYEVKRPQYWFSFGEKESIPLVLIALTSVLIVFMITASLYESLRKPLVILLSVPMSLVGLFAAFYLFAINFGRGGYAAVIFLIGLSVNNGIILVDRIARRVAEERGDILEVIIARAATQRLRPILITTLTTIAGFLPFVIGADIYSFWFSFAFAVIAGLSISTVMILLVMPVLYRGMQKEKIKK